MLNILSYVGMSLQSEVCLWTLLGLVRTIFDATLFKVNANLKQVWQMSMPEELSRPLQRALRTIISGIMLVQCFTVYVYLASYIVLLYPVFLEERPTLVLPWLLLAAIRKLLCELTSLALGLGTCVLLGPARPPCIKFVVTKVISIMPSFYMWMQLYTYYHVLKVASAFKSFPVVLPPSDHDYGLELAVRRRRTKSLLGEDQLRTKLIENLYSERQTAGNAGVINHKKDYSSRMTHGTDTSVEDLKDETNILHPLSTISNRMISDTGCYEDWFGSEVMVPRDTDRILEQFVLMMLRIGAYIKKDGSGLKSPNSQIFNSITTLEPRRDNMDSTTMPPDDTETPALVGSSKARTASYLRDYPQIFMKKPSDIPLRSDITLSLASDDRVSPSQKHRNQTLNDDNDTKTIHIRISDENASVENPIPSQKVNHKETMQRKLQTMSSEKSVTFKQMKLKHTLEDVQSTTTSEGTHTPGIGNNNSYEPEVADSLQSIINKNIENHDSNEVMKDEEHQSPGTSASQTQYDNDIHKPPTGTLILKSDAGSNTSHHSISDKADSKKNSKEAK